MKTHEHPRMIVILGAGLLAGITGSAARAGGLLSIEFDPANFAGTDPLVVDNPYWPLHPAGFPFQTFVYEAETADGCELNEIRVLPTPKLLMGAPPYNGLMALEVEDKAWIDEDCSGAYELEESTLDWYRQDIFGNIWYLGEDTRSFGDGCPATGCIEGSWEAGQPGPETGMLAEAGIVVPSDYPQGAAAAPLSSGTFYMQELAEGAEDMAKVLRTQARVIIESGDFAGEWLGCRETKEWTPLAPGSVEHKLYCPAPGFGLMLIEELSGGPTVEVELTEIR